MRTLLVTAAILAAACGGAAEGTWFCYDDAGKAKATAEKRGVGPFRNSVTAGTHVCTKAELDRDGIAPSERLPSQR